MPEKPPRIPHLCRCAECVADAKHPTAELHRQINQLALLLNEKDRRQFVGLLARQVGQGGISIMAQVTGLSRNTIRRGQGELDVNTDSQRIRAKGGGRSLTEKKRQPS
jgi:hypothetical protein